MVRRAASAICMGLVLAMAAAANAAPSPDGLWQIISDKDGKPRALIRVETVGGVVRGVLTQSLRGEDPGKLCVPCKGDEHNKRIIGVRVLWGLKPAPGDPATWQGGQILDPDSGNVYSAKITESADGRSLVVRGFVGISLLGRTQTWRRAN